MVEYFDRENNSCNIANVCSLKFVLNEALQAMCAVLDCLIVAAAWSVFRLQLVQERLSLSASRFLLVFAGAIIGLLSGLTRVGGGISLSPLLLIMGWASLRCTAGISAAFILLNSLAGLAGVWFKGSHFPAELPWWA